MAKRPGEVEVLKAGQTATGKLRHADGTEEPYTVTFTTQDLDALIAIHDPAKYGKSVIGADHIPKGPAYGTVDYYRRDGETLFAHVDWWHPKAEAAVKSGAYFKASANIIPDFKGTGQNYPAGFDILGRQWPAFDGMADVTLADGAPVLQFGGRDLLTFDGDVQQVEIVSPDQSYKAGDLQRELAAETLREKTQTVISKVRDKVNDFLWGAPDPATALPQVQQLIEDAKAAVTDPAIAGDADDLDEVVGMSNGGDEMKPEEFKAMLQQGLTEILPAMVKAEFAATLEPLKAGLAELTAGTEAQAAAARGQAVAAFSATVDRLITSENKPLAAAMFEHLAGATLAFAGPDGAEVTINGLEALQKIGALKGARPPQRPVLGFSHGGTQVDAGSTDPNLRAARLVKYVDEQKAKGRTDLTLAAAQAEMRVA